MTTKNTVRPRVYIAGPIRKGDLEKNLKQADEAVRALMGAGIAYYNPMWSCYAGGVKRVGPLGVNVPPGSVIALAHTDAHWPELKFEDWMENDYSWISVCQALLRLPGEATGADLECKFAMSIGVPVRYTVEAIIELLKPLPVFGQDLTYLQPIAVGSTWRTFIPPVDGRAGLGVGDKYWTPCGMTVQVVDKWEGRIEDVPSRVVGWAEESDDTVKAFAKKARVWVNAKKGTILIHKTKRIA